MELGSNLDLWSALVAMGVPFAAATINRARWGSLAKWLGFALVCVLAAAGTAYQRGDVHLDGERFARSLLVIATLATVYYRGWQGAVKEIEAATG